MLCFPTSSQQAMHMPHSIAKIQQTTVLKKIIAKLITMRISLRV